MPSRPPPDAFPWELVPEPLTPAPSARQGVLVVFLLFVHLIWACSPIQPSVPKYTVVSHEGRLALCRGRAQFP